ncbi:MAG: cell shape determining protein MreC [Candidatus Westeberhardia cardiocondylae]|nr:cell shape determining protein MreC [Candidatus Westeberhardia cardiocondylae]
MKKIFKKKFLPKLKILLAILLSCSLIFIEKHSNALDKIKYYLENIINPIYYIINVPFETLHHIIDVFIKYDKLKFENYNLYKKYLIKNNEQLLLEYYKKENMQLSKLLRFPIKKNEKKIVAKVLLNYLHINKDQIIINKGSKHDVYLGQPTLNESGIIGKVVAIDKNISKISPICSKLHAIPVKILRNNIHAILIGNGCDKSLILKHIPKKNNIKIGDILITSGLDGNFPNGYPIAIVSSILQSFKYPYYTFLAKPIAQLKYINYLLLYWKI